MLHPGSRTGDKLESSPGCLPISFSESRFHDQTEPDLHRLLNTDAQNGQPTRPQGTWRLRRTLWGTSQGDMRLRTKLEAVFNIRQSCDIFGSEYGASGLMLDWAYRL